MDARLLAQEVVVWYVEKLDRQQSHSYNVKKWLHGAVLSLTHRILNDQDTARSIEREPCLKGLSLEEEKKCSGDSPGKVSPLVEAFLLDKPNWEEAHSLGRRSKARLEAFLGLIEFSVPNFSERSPSSPGSKEENASTTVSSRSKPRNVSIGHKKPAQNKKQFQSSPVLTSLNNHGKALLRSVSEPNSRNQPQIREKELLIRLELYIRSLYRVRSLQKDCVLAVEPDKAIKARAEMIVSAFVSTVGCVRSMSPVLTRLLTFMTKEVLAAEFIGEELFRVIRRIVNEYEHGTSFASLAFLSSPEASAETRLTPLVLKYIRYLQSDWKCHERACELERMLACSLDGNMRRYFKTVEFQSIGHLLEICQEFRHELQNIELTPTAGVGHGAELCNNSEAVRQAIRDLQREVITVNGHVLPPVSSRKDLINLLSQSLNSRSLTASPGKNARGEGHPSIISTEQEILGSRFGSDNNGNDSSLDSNEKNNSPIQRKNSKDEWKSTNRRASFHLSTVDLLTRRLLIAASRTGTGGDAYFIVRDLFGDEDVEVVPAKVLPHHVRAARVGSIEIQVRLASVTIKCHGSFDIYPKALVGYCEPLIQLHTTSSETIYLQELRSCDSSSDDGRHCLEDDGSRSSDGMENLVLQEKKTNKTGKRILAIRPALYEKIQVWNTPS